MDTLMLRYGLSLLLLTSIASSTESNSTNEETREPRVNGRIVKLYSGVKPEPYLCTGEGFQGDQTNCAVFYRCVKEKSGKFSVFRYQCAPGTVYDPDLETCNFPRNTRRAECGGMKSTAETVHTSNINEIDGALSEIPRPISTKAPINSEHTTFKNPTASWILSTERQNIPITSSWGSNIHSTLSTVGTSQNKIIQSSSTAGYHWTSTQYQAETVKSSETTFATENTQKPNIKNNEPCTSDGFMGDSENCRKFYRCVGNQRGGYVKYEFSCSELTVWDDEIQGCNHPWAVKRSKCGRSLSYADTSTENSGLVATQSSTVKESGSNEGAYGQKSNKTTQQQLQISHGSKVTQTQTQISNSPEVIQNQTQINYGDKVGNNKNVESKQNQTQKSYGTAVSQTQTQINYGNKGVQTQLQIDHSKDSSQSQVQIHDAITDQPISTTAKNNNGNNECSESGFIGDTNDCKKFYRCVDNGRGKYTRFEYFCGDGTVWDPEIEACNHVWAVKSCGGKMSPTPTAEEQTAATTSTTTTTTITTTTKSSDYNTTPSKTTQSFSTISQNPDVEDEDDVGYSNQNNQEIPQPSSTTTLKTTTSSIKSTTTDKSNEATFACTSSGFIGDANNCKIFYRCVDNGNGGYTKHEFKCGDGTLWDSSIEACNHAWAVKNCGTSSSENVEKEETITKEKTTTTTTTPPPNVVSTTVTLVQITTQASTQIDDYDTGYGSQSHGTSTTTTTTKPAGQEETNKNNDCKASGFMGDKNDCKRFYRCVDNGNGGHIRYEFVCGEGTVWDPKIEACNHAWAVENCGGNGNTIESTETSSQSTHPISSSDTSSVHTTHVTEPTDKLTSTSMATTTKSSAITSSSNISNKCSTSGFMGDSTNCNKFYRCVDNGDGSYTRYEFACGEGTVWDPKIEACNHAWAVEKCGGSGESTHVTEQTTSQQSVMQDEEQENGYVTPSYEASEPAQTTSSTSSSSATSATSSGTSQCNESGFMGDKNDCKKFYRCVDNGKGGYDKYEFQCGEGTAWDSDIEACNHASAVKDCGGSLSGTTHFQNESTTQSLSSSTISIHDQTQQSTEKSSTSTTAHQESETGPDDKCAQEGFFGSKIDCKKFYRCVDNGKGGFTKYEFTCGEGTSWNQEIQSCDHVSPERSCTSQVSPSSEPVYLSDDMDIQTTSTTKATTPTKEIDNGSTQTIKKPQEAQGTCQSEGFYADSLDCKKFYRCVANGNGGYTKYNFNCGDGTVWNQDIQACDHESADKKCKGTFTSETHTTESQTESVTSPYSTTKKQDTNKPVEATESTGSEHCTYEGFFAHPYDCKKFIRCVNNGNGGYTRYEFSCGDGTVWVQEIQACDHDNDVTSCSSQSGLVTTSKPQNTEVYTSTTTAAPSTVSVSPSNENDEYDNGYPDEPSHDEMDSCASEGYFSNSQDCKKFYRCVDNGNGGFTKYDFVCGEGTAWDSNLQTCNHISEVQSCSGSTQENNENHQTTTNKNQAATESSSTTQATTTTTSDSSSSSSEPTSNSKDTCESEGYFGNSKDCKKFYRCVDNGKGGFTKYDFTCGDGTIWDKDITSCNHPQDVSNPSCGLNQGTSDNLSTSSSTTSSSSQTSSSTTESNTSSQTTSDCSQESSKKPTNYSVTCDKAGFHANPNDCKKFYRCVDWDGDGKKFSVFHFECGEGTIWDPALDTCNHEESVYPRRDCTQTQSQNVGGETTTTATESTTNAQTTEESTAQPSVTTTTEQSTNEPNTSQQPTTTDQTTTQQSTTNEPTTTEQSATSEQTTTQQSTTNEPTTSQQPTTTDQTTTQQSTTNEPTTTEQSTTSEQTTTQQSSISQETTTQQSTTSEQTTTQQSTTSDQTTPQQSTTSEQTTTDQSTTSEQTTTPQSTTSEQTTTQQSETTEQTTTEQSTSEQTTTQQPTTEQTTTQQSTTSESTTEQSTSEQQTTTLQSTTSEQTTTQQTTTEQSTSEQTTTQDSSTTEQTTTQQSTTTDQATTQESSTTDQTTTQESSTTEQMTTEQTTEGLTTTEETTNQSTTQSSSTESDSTVDQSTTESSTTQSSSSLEKECPETEDDQYLLVCPTSFKRHPKYCNMFYQCTEDEETYEAKMAMFKCPNNTIYDENQTQCVTEDKADKKCNGEMANKRRFKRLGSNYKDPIVADKGKQSCSTTGYFSFEKNSECAKGFLKCERSKNGKLRGYVYQCPDGYIYWSISKRCERVENVRDCKRSTNDWTGRWNIPVERKNISTR